MMPVLQVVLLSLALLARTTVAFYSIGGTSSHVSITATAVMQQVTEACRAVIEEAGQEFKPTGSSPEELAQACLGPTAKGQVSGAKFHSALQEIYTQNGVVDRDFAGIAPYHFNSEAFLEGRGLINEGMAGIKANIRKENFQAARETLGRILHTLQDFYSHSNWVELGNSEPYINLLRPDLPFENLADVNTPTCKDCESAPCPNSILPAILNGKKLTSGYMGVFYSAKPQGKCSHGGQGDLTSTTIPRGGINKDERRYDNIASHKTAVNIATTASQQLLENIRQSAGNRDFLRMMGIARSAVVCFVMDTTGSMSDDIAEARAIVNEMIESKQGTQDEPSEYILVPFNDPDFGPMIRTPDPKKMKDEIAKLRARGGGDRPEMCLSGLQLALTGSPAGSHIYVFTDAAAKDIELKDTIDALIRRTKSTVTFFMTSTSRRRRRSLRDEHFEHYKHMSLASGGQAILVTKKQLPEATSIVRDTSTSALVTILQRVVNPGKTETFSFLLDESLKNVTIYITGATVFTLTNAAGVSQSNSEASGKLGTIQTVGNLRRIRLNDDHGEGKWKIQINSVQPYTVKVTGQSVITFIYNFVEKFEGPHPGYALLSGRPQAGQPATLLLSVVGKRGPSSMSVGSIGLVTMSGPESVSNGTITDMGNGDMLVTIDAVPEGEFLVVLTGKDKMSKTEFQRQSTTLMSMSKVNIQAMVASSVEPGKPQELPFTVMTSGDGGTFTIKATNDKDFPMTYPKSLTLTTGKRINDTLTIIPPPKTPTGTDITLTMEARSPTGVDSNYVVLRLSVVTKIRDFVPPVCKVVKVLADDCPEEVSACGASRWELSASITDGNGTGIDSISLQRGNGTFSHTPLNNTVIQAKYSASCCSQIVEFVAVDDVGNVGKCFHSIARSAGPPALSLSLSLLFSMLVSAFVARP